MKCYACNYEYEEEWIKKDDKGYTTKIIKGDVKFIQTDTNIVYEDEGSYYNRIEKKSIIICPKCGTLKVDI